MVDAIASNMGKIIFEATSCKHTYCQRKFLLKNCIEIILFKDY